MNKKLSPQIEELLERLKGIADEIAVGVGENDPLIRGAQIEDAVRELREELEKE